MLGTTSACAENTVRFNPLTVGGWNYLRVRGEYAAIAKPNAMNGELPPRARRIREIGKEYTPQEGTTSACAENTLNELGLL